MSDFKRVLTFKDGRTASVTLPVGTYTVTGIDIPGYTRGATVREFTVRKRGDVIPLELIGGCMLTAHVRDEEGDSIEGAELLLTDRSGDRAYVKGKRTNESGNVFFKNLPYDSNKRLKVWVKQISSDRSHAKQEELEQVVLDKAEEVAVLVNPTNKQVTFTVKDENYPDMVELTGSITIQRKGFTAEAEAE